uniref:Protein farnesyltransferase subunit beta n=1 Tax=Equus asinus TaxID=9793 RepID=A0A9L0KC86_EQUAS
MASPSSFTYYCPPSSSPVWSEPLYSLRPEHARERLQDDSVETVTSIEQAKVEEKIQEVFSSYKFNHLIPRLILQREKHFHYLKRGLRQLTDAYECLDASRPWLCYWILHSLELLDEPIPQMVATDVCQFLELCQSPDGGFGGGPGQYPHLAPTYAAVNALCIIGTEEAYDVINREKLLEYLYSLKQPDGSFLMHVGGEVDVRSAYCAASVASLTNIITPDLFEGTAEWIARCQNWEGGIGGVPGMEAHGGYTFCGLAALVILKKERSLNLKSLLQWVTSRQMRFEGGFQGRCNKLVDGCYSFWQAGLLPLLHRALHAQGLFHLHQLEWRDPCSFLWSLKWECKTKAVRESAKLLGAFSYYLLKSQAACGLLNHLSFILCENTVSLKKPVGEGKPWLPCWVLTCSWPRGELFFGLVVG